MNANINFPDTPEKYLPLRVLSALYGISTSSLKQLFHAARRRGIPLPERKRVRRLFSLQPRAFQRMAMAKRRETEI